ncbi:MAG TPA: ATP-binding protein [Pseudonocardiaceae bacterium]|nr:ATP-binding protein [Pseudonocardiaceae bacterium]
MDADIRLNADTANALATNLAKLVEAARFRVSDTENDPLVARITDHLDRPLLNLPSVTETFGAWQHVNIQRGLDAYLAAHSPDAEWFGIAGAGRNHQDLVDMLTDAALRGNFHLGAVDYRTVATGPDSATEAVQVGLVNSVAPDGKPIVVGVRGPNEFRPPQTTLHVIAAEKATATAARDEITRLMKEHNAFRGALLQFDVSENRGNELLSYLHRPRLAPEDVILPEGTLETIEKHVVRGSERNAALIANGQHLKRGVLLYGPPGTGKTHTVRYLMSRLTEATVVVLSGRAMRFLAEASAVVRGLQPAVLVIEDVDLIAEDRSMRPGSGPLLFELLNRIDGVDADADVTFILTTNRVEVLEKALVERPGRVDLALEIPKPGPAERERLLRLYARTVDLDLPDPSELIAELDGVTASFVRELVRRAVLRELDANPDGQRVRLDTDTLRDTLRELTGERQELTGRILGGR